MPPRHATPPTNLTSSQDFWSAMVVPDCEDYRRNIASLRHAVHSAVSLFHLHDWVFQSDPSTVTTFTYIDQNGIARAVSKAPHFANHLEQACSEFGLIRGVANAAKHLALTHPSSVPNSPTHAANTQVQTTGYGVGGYGALWRRAARSDRGSARQSRIFGRHERRLHHVGVAEGKARLVMRRRRCSYAHTSAPARKRESESNSTNSAGPRAHLDSSCPTGGTTLRASIDTSFSP
jgi:hypothetical protein